MSTTTTRPTRSVSRVLPTLSKVEHLDAVLLPSVQAFVSIVPTGWRVAICDCEGSEATETEAATLPAVRFWDGGFDTAAQALFAAWAFARQEGLLAPVETTEEAPTE